MGLSQEPPGRIGPEELQRQTFAAVRALVARFAAVGPTALVLEDLHWADPTSLRLTAELAELTADRSLLLIATSRPGRRAPASRPRNPPSSPGRRRGEVLAMSLLGKVGEPPGARRRARERRRQPLVP